MKWSPDQVSMIKLPLLKCLFCKHAAMWNQVEQRSLAFLPRLAISCVTGGTTQSWKHSPSSSPVAARLSCGRRNKKQFAPISSFTHLWLQALAATFPPCCLPSSCQAPSGAWVGAAQCPPFFLPLALDQGAGLSHMKATHWVCVSEQDLHQILGFKRWAQPCTTSRWEEWDAGRVIIRVVWWATELELLTPHPLPWQRPNLALFINLAGDHLRLENVLWKTLIASNSCFCLKVKTVFLVLKQKTV